MYTNYIKRKIIFIAQRRVNSVLSLKDLSATTNALIVSFKHEISDTQIYPFYFYKKQLKNKSGIKFQEISLPDLNSEKSVAINNRIKRIYFQHSFMMPHDEAVKCLKFLSLVFPSAKIAFMDWFGPLSINYSGAVNQYVDIYIKKQIFKNFNDYNQITLGDTNLSDYYGRRHRIDLPQTNFLAPEGFEKKLRLWPNFYLSPQMVDLFLGSAPNQSNRPIDLHARIAVNGFDWYQAMRQESFDSINSLNGYNVVSEGRVRRHQFFDELRKSKIVFSPFGYGEVCWRDYEAFATGGLLLKPCMNHLETFSKDFISDKTYIEIPWNLEFLHHKVETCIQNFDKFDEMRKQAFFNIQNLIQGNEIPEYIENNFY